MPWFAEVILPIPIRSVYTYLVPDNWVEKSGIGFRATVPLGKNKLLTGVISKLYEEEIERLPDTFSPKPIEGIPDAGPVLLESQLELIRWVAFYYACSEGEVLNLCLPAALKPESLPNILPGDSFPDPDEKLKPNHRAFFNALSENAKLTLDQAVEILGIKYPHPRLNEWAEKGWLRFDRELQITYKPKTKTIVEIPLEIRHKDSLEMILQELEKFPKRELAFMQVVAAWMGGRSITPQEIKKNTGITDSVIKTLEKQGYLQLVSETVDRTAGLAFSEKGTLDPLTPLQQTVVEKIWKSLSQDISKPILIQGITGSGKTRVYQELIREALELDRQVLYLIPEIALTRQIIDRLKSEYGERVGVYHSRFNDQERVEIWNKVLQGEFQVVIGVRSAIFLPFRDLGLIVVDEEHDSSFRQHDRPPFFHARNVAIWYARHFGIPLILGSATPSLESKFNAEKGRFVLLEMNERAQQAIPPEIHLVDMRNQEKNGLSRGIFSDVLIQELTNCLNKGEQAIILQNRRGFATVQICKNCATITRCIHCAISLSWHKKNNEMKCHYCGYSQELLHRCEKCGSMQLALQGYGTERVEEELLELFPTARILRMDQDSTRGKNAAGRIIEKMEEGNVDFLVGTQMVSKGLDFEKVSLAAIVNADHALDFPDFRSSERAYQLFTQVAGRAGRRSKRGKVIIQSRKTNHFIFNLLDKGFDEFYEWESQNRKEAVYPPWCRLIRLELRHQREDAVTSAGQALLEELMVLFGSSVMGPEPPLIPRIRNENRLQFMIKLDLKADPVKVRKNLLSALEKFYKTPFARAIKVRIEIDPA